MTNEFGDRPIRDLIPEIERHVELGRVVLLKWVCPACGERVTSNDPNSYCTQGYVHEEKKDGTPCGQLYTGELFGYLLMYRHSGPR
jgi:hypothetical protein